MTDDRMTRRTALRQVTIAGTGAALAAGLAASEATKGHAVRQGRADHSVTILLDEPIATIRPELYSQFTEHIGGVIYDGIWVGPDFEGAEYRRDPPRSGRAGAPARRPSPFAGRAAALPIVTTGAMASVRATVAPAVSAAGARKPRPTSSELMSSSGSAVSVALRPIWPATSEPARPRNFSSGSSIATPRPAPRPSPTNEPPPASASRSASDTGASATKAGAAAASSRPKIIAANFAGLPSGFLSTACRST